jgi:hypothetical protein
LHSRHSPSPSPIPTPLQPASIEWFESPVEDPTAYFLSHFNPVLEGIRILLHERLPYQQSMAKPYTRVSPRKHRVSIDLKKELHQILAAYEGEIITDVSVYQAVALSTPIIVDTGASTHVTPHKDDFIPGTYGPSKAIIKDLSGLNKVAGEGMVCWKVLDIHGQEVELTVRAYHIPVASVRLLSPQTLLDEMHGGQGTLLLNKFWLTLPSGVVLDTPFGRAHLPVLQSSLSSSPSSFWAEAFDFRSFHAATTPSDWALSTQTLLNPANSNLTPGQRELLRWHYRLSQASLSTIHNLTRHRRAYAKTSAKSSPEGSVPIPRHSLPCTSNVPHASRDGLKCLACQYAKAQRKKPSVKSKAVSDHAPLKAEHLSPGDCVSCDHYVSPVAGRVVADSGHSSSRDGYVGGTIYVDHASGWMFHHPQKSLRASDTLRGKQQFEHFAAEFDISIKKFHTDNGVFRSDEFMANIHSNGQKISFSGVGAHHQNGVAKRAIRTVCEMARASMLHAQLCWPGRTTIDLWPLAMSYAIWVHNRLPPNGAGMSPEEIWCSTKSDGSELRRAHVFGCPVYVLDPALQDNKKIPKWNSRSRQGIFVGFSEQHSSLVPLVLNPSTQHISPQYHVVFDDDFTTVPSLTTVEERDKLFEWLFETRTEKYTDSSDLPDGQLTLRKEWLTPAEIAAGRSFDLLDSSADVPAVPEGAFSDNDDASVEFLPPPVSEGDALVPEGDDRVHPLPALAPPTPPPAPPIAQANSPPTPPPAPPIAQANSPSTPPTPPHDPPIAPPSPQPLRRSSRHRAGSYRDGPVYDRNIPHHRGQWVTGLLAAFSISNASAWAQPPARIANVGIRDGPVYGQLRIQRSSLDEFNLLQEDWSVLGTRMDLGLAGSLSAHITADVSAPVGSRLVSDIQPHILQAKASKHDTDNPSFAQAMNSANADHWWDAMETEMQTLEDNLDCWELVERTPDMKVLPVTWAFKLKRFPDGLAKKFKARFCVRGDMQVQGIDFFESWSLVVNWHTVRLLMILSTKLNLHSAQADITAAFVHAHLKPHKTIYIHQPPGFHRPGNYVLKLKRSLYGMRQSPKYFFEYLSTRLQKQGLRQSDFDPCLFIGKTVIVVTYVDDLLFYARDDNDINQLIAALRDDDILIRREGTAEGFLGVDVSRTWATNGRSPTITLTQKGLTICVIEALGLCTSYTTKLDTPAEVAALPKDADGTPASGTFNYVGVVGMLLYLSGHSRPDIAFAVHQCARYTFAPTALHEQALKRIGRYLKGRIDKGLIMTPSDRLQLDCYPDADFAGLYGHEDSQDPHCVRSRTGFVFCYQRLRLPCPLAQQTSDRDCSLHDGG